MYILLKLYYFNIIWYLLECREYYSLTTNGGGSIDPARSCNPRRATENKVLTIVGGTVAEENEFPHMASTYNRISKKHRIIRNIRQCIVCTMHNLENYQDIYHGRERVYFKFPAL